MELGTTIVSIIPFQIARENAPWFDGLTKMVIRNLEQLILMNSKKEYFLGSLYMMKLEAHNQAKYRDSLFVASLLQNCPYLRRYVIS